MDHFKVNTRNNESQQLQLFIFKKKYKNKMYEEVLCIS